MQQSGCPGCANRRQESVAATLHDAVHHIVAAKTGVWQKPQLCIGAAVIQLVCTLSCHRHCDMHGSGQGGDGGPPHHGLQGHHMCHLEVWFQREYVLNVFPVSQCVPCVSMCSLCLNVFSVSQCVLRVSMCSVSQCVLCLNVFSVSQSLIPTGDV